MDDGSVVVQRPVPLRERVPPAGRCDVVWLAERRDRKAGTSQITAIAISPKWIGVRVIKRMRRSLRVCALIGTA